LAAGFHRFGLEAVQLAVAKKTAAYARRTRTGGEACAQLDDRWRGLKLHPRGIFREGLKDEPQGAVNKLWVKLSLRNVGLREGAGPIMIAWQE
jgi:hypothetical protein